MESRRKRCFFKMVRSTRYLVATRSWRRPSSMPLFKLMEALGRPQWLFSRSRSRVSGVLKPSRPHGVRLLLPAATSPERERTQNTLSLRIRGFLASDRIDFWQVAGTALYLGSCRLWYRSDCGCARSGCFPRAGSPGVYFLLAILKP